MRAFISLGLFLITSCASLPEDAERFVTTDDGVDIHYRLSGPEAAPVLWVGYPWTEDWAQTMNENGLESEGTSEVIVLIAELIKKYRVLHVDYPRGTGRTTGPLPADLLPETVAKDYETVAEAAGVDRFVALGYSWGGGFGLQVAARTDRCAGLAIGGWPALGAPYEEILAAQRRNIEAMPEGPFRKISRSNINFYDDIVRNYDEEEALRTMQDRAGLLYLYVGSEDAGVPEMGLTLPIAERIVANRDKLEGLGWAVEIIDGYDHMTLTVEQWLPGVLEFLDGKTW